MAVFKFHRRKQSDPSRFMTPDEYGRSRKKAQPDAFDRQILAAGAKYAAGVRADSVGTRREQLRSRIERLQAEERLDPVYAANLISHQLDPADAAGLDRIEVQIGQIESRLEDGQDDAAIQQLADSQLAQIGQIKHHLG